MAAMALGFSGASDHLQAAARQLLQVGQFGNIQLPKQRLIVGALVVRREVGAFQIAAEQLGARHAAGNAIGNAGKGLLYLGKRCGDRGGKKSADPFCRLGHRQGSQGIVLAIHDIDTGTAVDMTVDQRGHQQLDIPAGSPSVMGAMAVMMPPSWVSS